MVWRINTRRCSTSTTTFIPLRKVFLINSSTSPPCCDNFELAIISCKNMMGTHYNGGSQNQSLKNLEIVGVTSVSPAKLTEPRRVCQVLFSDAESEDQKIHTRTIQGCYQIVLYYEKANEVEDHDWSLTGWIVESLAKALLEYPLLAGRLKRREVGDDETGLEIVSNDSGVRLLEARCSMMLSEFLELNKKEQHEAQLVFWNEIDAQFPEFSPLFYVQVTNFICGGYSIGISCSLLLAEVSVVENFLKKWAQIHMLSQNEKIETSIFNHCRLKNIESLPSENLISHTQSKNGVQSMIFRITAKDVNNFSKELWRELAVLCIKDAEQKLGKTMGSSFTLVVKESPEVIEVENCTKSGYSMQGSSFKDQIEIRTTWNDFGVHGVIFRDENKPVHVSCWIGSVADGHVMAVPCPEENAFDMIVVSPR